jgi:uncharacterized circularly permuted ATP-grasp superfamily protein/uncharacterized alpha-E superfamily protein
MPRVDTTPTMTNSLPIRTPSDLRDRLDAMGSAELGARQRDADRLIESDRVTYNVTSGFDAGVRSWALDPIPALISADDWSRLGRGLQQRAVLLDLVLADLYGPRRIVSEGLVPPEVVFGHDGFLRSSDEIRIPGEHQLFHVAFDVGHDESGRDLVIADRTQAPSGIGYALENRIVVSRVLPDLYSDAEVVRLAPFFRTLRASLQTVAPPDVEHPRIVVMTPGPRSKTSFEHAFLASYLGYPLVQGSDLRVRDGRVWMRTLGRLEPVHVILRRVDAEWCDPLELSPDSQLGVPGLSEACRLGNVSVVNTLGSGVLENPGLIPFLPGLAAALLGEELRLESVPTWWCGEKGPRRHVLANLDRLVVKPLSSSDPTSGLASSARSSPVAGWSLTTAELDSLRDRIEAEPYRWVGQEAAAVGTVPTLAGAELEPRRSVVRAFAVSAGDAYSVMPGALTRIASSRDDVWIANQAGTRSKDTWVLTSGPERLTGFWLESSDASIRIEPETSMSSRAAENLFWLARYAERAEDLVRQLRVASDRLTEFAPGANPAGTECIEVLLRALTLTTGAYPGFVGDGAEMRLANPGPEVRALVNDVGREGSVAHAVRRMLDAAAEVRDQLSPDTWLVVGDLDRHLTSLDPHLPVAAATGALARTMQALLALAGLAAESMVRDDGWQFLEVGRRIERGIQLCSLLSATLTDRRDDATDSLVLESVLTAAESIITYRRRYRSRARVETLLDLLLLDDANPRSLAHQVDRLAGAVSAMPLPSRHEATAGDLVRDLAGSIRLLDTNLMARATHHERREDLAAFLGTSASKLRALADALDTAHFAHQLPQRAAFAGGAA